MVYGLINETTKDGSLVDYITLSYGAFVFIVTVILLLKFCPLFTPLLSPAYMLHTLSIL